MNVNPIVDDFFSEVNKRVDAPLGILLTGAMAGVILGSVRPSMDIDFEVECSAARRGKLDAAEKVQTALEDVSKRLKIPIQYSWNIQGWSQISFLNYRETSLSYKKIGNIGVRLLEPGHWSIGKMARFVELDRIDVASVFKKRKVAWKGAVGLWGKALRTSDLSDKSREFRDHVFDFLKHDGKKVWGSSFDVKAGVSAFKSAAGIRP